VITAQGVYTHLPHWCQFLALNGYGMLVRRSLTRTGRLIQAIAQSEVWSPEEQVAYVQEHLRRVLTHAVTSVPRYAGLRRYLPDLGDCSISPFELLEVFPRITKREVAENPGAFVSVGFKARRLVRTQTSGSTGTPLTLWLTREAKNLADALWHRRTVWAGYVNGDWTARIVGDPAVPPSDATSSTVYRSSYPDRRLYFSARHLTPGSIPRIVRVLNRRRPAFVMGYPSALSFIANEAMERTPLSYKPKAVLYSSEPMNSYQRMKIEAYFGAPVRGLYGCAERIVSAAECSAGKFHLSVVDGYVEGQYGDLSMKGEGLVTGLRNLAMPLIRYDLGDPINMERSTKCMCGRTLPIVGAVESRRGDAIVTSRGRHVPAPLLTLVFKDLDTIRRAQLIQESTQDVHVRIDTDPSAASEMVRVVHERIQAALYGEMKVRVSVSGDVEETPTGKVPFVINRAARPEPWGDRGQA
jgi:phenylacetate-CoA ligase